MNALGPEEVDVPYDPLDVVEHVLNAENLPFDRTDDGDLAFALAGDWKIGRASCRERVCLYV